MEFISVRLGSGLVKNVLNHLLKGPEGVVRSGGREKCVCVWGGSQWKQAVNRYSFLRVAASLPKARVGVSVCDATQDWVSHGIYTVQDSD